jgi:hypothetical protein
MSSEDSQKQRPPPLPIPTRASNYFWPHWVPCLNIALTAASHLGRESLFWALVWCGSDSSIARDVEWISYPPPHTPAPNGNHLTQLQSNGVSPWQIEVGSSTLSPLQPGKHNVYHGMLEPSDSPPCLIQRQGRMSLGTYNRIYLAPTRQVVNESH